MYGCWFAGGIGRAWFGYGPCLFDAWGMVCWRVLFLCVDRRFGLIRVNGSNELGWVQFVEGSGFREGSGA